MEASSEPRAVDRRGAASDRKGCLELYGLWIAVVAAGHAHGERLLARAAAGLGFGIRRVSWRKGERLEPVFDFEPSDRDWFFDLLEGTPDGAEAVAYAAMAPRGASRGTPHKALGSSRRSRTRGSRGSWSTARR